MQGAGTRRRPSLTDVLFKLLSILYLLFGEETPLSKATVENIVFISRMFWRKSMLRTLVVDTLFVLAYFTRLIFPRVASSFL